MTRLARQAGAAWVLGGCLLLGVATAAAAADERLAAFRQAWADYQQQYEAGGCAAALPAAERALALGEEIFGDRHPNTAALTYNHALCLLQTGQADAGKVALFLALRRYEAVYGKDSAELIPVLMDLGSATAKVYDSALQQRYLNRALRLAAKRYGKQSPQYARLSIDAGIRILDGAKLQAARKYLYSGYELLQESAAADDPDLAMAAFNLGKLELGSGHYQRAERLFRKALEAFQRRDEPAWQQLQLTARAFLVQTYEKLGKRDLATEQSLVIGRMSPGVDAQDYQPLYKAVPVYPEEAALARKEGYVIVEFTVDERGFVRDPQVVELHGPRSFAREALKAIEQWRYAPRFVDGQPVATPGVRHRLSFELAK